MADATPISETLAVARVYVNAGLSVIPVRADGTKAPAHDGWREYSNRLPKPDELWKWFGPDAEEILGVGIPGGPASGNLAVLDFETAAVWGLWLASIPSDTSDWVDDCPLVRPPGGGAHLYCRLPEPVPGVVLARHLVDGKPKTLIEIRGDGHQVLAPGCPAHCHPSGRPYSWERLGWIEDGFRAPIPFSVWFDWLPVAVALNQYVPPEPIATWGPPRERIAGHNDPGTDFNHNGSWDETGLFEAGWTWDRQLSPEQGLARRPGKSSGKSGTVGLVTSKANGWPLFYCFTSNGYPFEAERSYDRFGVLARLKHRGDFTATARWLGEHGYGDQTRTTNKAPVASAPSPGDPPQSPQPPAKKLTSKFKFTNVAEFLAADYRPRWLVPRVLVRAQPAVIAAPSKAMKTSVVLDLAVSLATGTPFLGKFPVKQPVRVAIASGESGEHVIKETILRVMAARGLGHVFPDPKWLWLEFALPIFSEDVLMSDFAGHLERLAVDVVIIDPTYLSLGEVDARNLFEMGAALRKVADHLGRRRPDLTVILVHHANRLLPVGEVMELSHLAYSGLEQWARQFFLMNRREPFRHDGIHELWFRVGGSAGHGGLWALHIDEGILEEDWTGRKWDVTVQTPTEADQNAQQAREAVKRGQRVTQLTKDEQAILAVIDQEAAKGRGGATMTTIRAICNFGLARAKEVISRLIESEAIIKVELTVKGGHGAEQVIPGYSRPPD